VLYVLQLDVVDLLWLWLLVTVSTQKRFVCRMLSVVAVAAATNVSILITYADVVRGHAARETICIGALTPGSEPTVALTAERVCHTLSFTVVPKRRCSDCY
jgi:hypothetical protein